MDMISPIRSQTPGSRVWSELHCDAILGLRVQTYMTGLRGHLGALFRSLKGEDHHSYRIITTDAPFYVLAQADNEASILHSLDEIRTKFPSAYAVRWFCESEWLLTQLQDVHLPEPSPPPLPNEDTPSSADSFCIPCVPNAVLERAHVIALACNSAAALCDLYERLRLSVELPVFLTVGEIFRDNLSILFHEEVVAKAGPTELQNWHTRFSMLLSTNVSADERAWIRRTLVQIESCLPSPEGHTYAMVRAALEDELQNPTTEVASTAATITPPQEAEGAREAPDANGLPTNPSQDWIDLAAEEQAGHESD